MRRGAGEESEEWPVTCGGAIKETPKQVTNVTLMNSRIEGQV